MKSWKYGNPEFECDKLNYDLLKFAPWSGHRNFVYDFMAFFEPKTVVELGSHYGCSAFTFAQAAKDHNIETEMYFVDTWEGDDFTKKYNNDVYKVFSETVEKYYSKQNINMLRMTFDEAVGKFKDHSIDVLHIDGSHYYDDVKRDFEIWFKKVSEKGIIMLHDVSSDIVLGDIMGSHKFWLELKNEYKYTYEFDFSWGLGIIFLDKGMYKNFKSEIDGAKYQRLNNALDVEYKDQLRKNYFRLKDDDIYINDLLKQRDILNEHLDSYKKSVEEKDKYAEELVKQRERDVDEIKQAYEKTINEINENSEKEKNNIINDYENNKRAVTESYEKQIEEVKKNYENTIRGKDAYIAELEAVKKEKDELESRYRKTIDYKFNEFKQKFKK
ncbi:MAG: class I SAM-dependent methyltransferase [Clostridia bacterium]|nr:class I SAM-dependent methyltransferase [Clostridia bacterium]